MINSIRRQLAPLSLAEQKAYRSPDVLEALYEDFGKKCYITEFVFSDMGLMEIDHFATQNEAPNRVYDWTNLYPIHEKANKIRLKHTPVGGYLDPCSNQDDVERDIEYRIRFDGTVSFKAIDPNNTKAVNTAMLLTRAHKDFKGAISEKHNEVVTTLWKWTNARQKVDKGQLWELELLLQSLLSRTSAFTMLMRAIDDVPVKFFD